MTRSRTDLIVVHCSDTPADMDIGAETIREWHTDPKPVGRGWSDIGYHFVIRRNGRIELGRDINAIGAHARGYNNRSVSICLVGGQGPEGDAEDNFTASQYNTLDHLVATLSAIYGAKTRVVGHNELNPNKDCPCFDWRRYFRRVL